MNCPEEDGRLPHALALNGEITRRKVPPTSCLVCVQLPQGVEIEGIYNAAPGVQPPRYWLFAFPLWRGQWWHTVGARWALTEKGAKAMIASLARAIEV